MRSCPESKPEFATKKPRNRYNFHVVEVHPDVNAVIEAIIWDNSRPVDPWAEGIEWTSTDMHQTDIQPVANALDDLVSSLRLNSSYTMFLMNPKVLSDPITMETLQFFGKDSVLCVCAFVSVCVCLCVWVYVCVCVCARQTWPQAFQESSSTRS